MAVTAPAKRLKIAPAGCLLCGVMDEKKGAKKYFFHQLKPSSDILVEVGGKKEIFSTRFGLEESSVMHPAYSEQTKGFFRERMKKNSQQILSQEYRIILQTHIYE